MLELPLNGLVSVLQRNRTNQTCVCVYIYIFVVQLCLTLCNPTDCSTSGFPVLHHLPELAQTHVHWVGDAIQPSHPLLSPSPPALQRERERERFIIGTGFHDDGSWEATWSALCKLKNQESQRCNSSSNRSLRTKGADVVWATAQNIISLSFLSLSPHMHVFGSVSLENLTDAATYGRP